MRWMICWICLKLTKKTSFEIIFCVFIVIFEHMQLIDSVFLLLSSSTYMDVRFIWMVQYLIQHLYYLAI